MRGKRQGVTQEEVNQAAQLLASKGENPTVDKILAVLGTGSKSTLCPLVKTWKDENRDVEAYLRKKQLNIEVNCMGCRQKEKVLHEQMMQNENLLCDLRHSENQAQDCKLKQENVEKENLILRLKTETMTQEREVFFDKVTADKNSIIKELKAEITAAYNHSFEEIQKIGYRSDSKVMEEKVVNKNLSDKIISLEKELEVLQSTLELEGEKSNPLRKRIQQQEKIIEKFVSFDQLQEMELQESNLEFKSD